MPLKRCACGREVRLRAQRVSFNRRQGVAHWIEHVDGTKVPDPPSGGAWACVQMKPYPAKDCDLESSKLISRWDTR